MRRYTILTLIVPLAFLAFTALVFLSAPARAQDVQAICEGSGGTFVKPTDPKSTDPVKRNGSCTGGTRTIGGTFREVADILIYLVGAISVIMVIVGGLRYTLSGGDSAGVNSAKNTILYAVVGIVIAGAAFGIVQFVTANFK